MQYNAPLCKMIWDSSCYVRKMLSKTNGGVMRRLQIGVILLLLILLLTSCKEKEEDVDVSTEDIVIEAITYEAEDAILQGSVKVESSKSGYSGTGYVVGIEEDTDTCTFQIEIDKEDFYDLNVVSLSLGGYKENLVFVDEQNIGVISTESNSFTDSMIERVYLDVGSHDVTIKKSWGWIGIDSLKITASKPLDKAIYDVPATLVNPNADENSKRLMSYLTDIYGEYFLSGQYCDTGMYGNEVAAIWNVTDGKFPAVLGLDFIEYSPSRVANGSTSKATEYAIDFWNKGGIVTFCWHWNAPVKYLTDTWWKGFYKEASNIDLAAIMNGEDKEGYDLLVSDIDAIAVQLKKLQDEGVPILWRPLHEASGGWFWWGAAGADAYKKLYIMLYDRLTNYHEINNLIWLWNGQDGEWYPGDEYVDIIGEDIYPGERVYTSQVPRFLKALSYTSEKKMIVLSENGCLFDPDLAIRDGAMWGFYATWGGEFVTKSSTLNFISEKYTEEAMIKKVYGHEKVLTLDELPDLKTYEIHE